MANTKRHINVWRLTLILLAVAVFSTYLVSWIAAKFVSKSDSSDQARVALFEVTDDFYEERTVSLTYEPGADTLKTIEVKNSGEVTIRYTVTVTNLTNNLPLVFESIKQEIASGGTQVCELKVQPAAGLLSADDAGKVDLILLTVRAEQID